MLMLSNAPTVLLAAGELGFVDIITNAIRKLYTDISGMFTLICVVVLVICLIGQMVSKSQKTVEEFKMWQKRVIWSWVIFNLLGAIARYGQELFPKQEITGL